jgi:signal peptidase I
MTTTTTTIPSAYAPPASEAPPAPMWRPRPIVSALLNLTAGLGHVYSGRPIQAIAVFVLSMALSLTLWTVSGLAGTRALRLEIAGLVIASNLVGLPILGFLVARRAAPSHKRWFQHWYVLLSYAIVAWLVVPRVWFTIVPGARTSYRTAGQSMQPTLYPDDRVVATAIGTPQRGDVVVVQPASGQFWVRRIIALPGDTVELRNFHAFVNGLPETPRLGPCNNPDYPGTWSPEIRRFANFGPITVPEGQYALFGDCRDNARDVRQLGFTPRAQIVSRVSWIVWSSTGAHGRPGFDRVGTPVR